MRHCLFGAKPDASAPCMTGSLVDLLEEHPGEDFIQGIRDRLNGLLELARASARFPWRNATETYLTGMHVNSMSRWLPPEEAAALRRAFAQEMDRLYEAADQMRPEIPGDDPR